MKLYSLVYPDWSPLSTFYPDAECVYVRNLDQLKEPGIVISWGGADIHPSLYGRENVASYVPKEPTRRDLFEQAGLKRAAELGLLIFGVCRGAQLACAVAGGILIQDVHRHGSAHAIRTNDGRILHSSSLHHQMMFPWLIPHELWAWSYEALSPNHYEGLTDSELATIPNTPDGTKCEPEVVWFPTIKALAVQGHPEFMDPQCPFNLYMKELLDAKLRL